LNREVEKTGGMKKRRRPSVGNGQVRPGEAPRGASPAQASRGFGRNELLMAATLAIATLAVYGQVIGHQFVDLDDDLSIRDNPMVSGGLTLKGIAWAFTTFHDSNWHPLTWLSHMVDCQIFGLKAGGHLFVNALIHVANTLLLFLLLKRLTGAGWRSVIVAALFALHPLHVESVAWAVERKDTLSTLFGLLSLVAYARYAEAPSWKRYALVALWLSLGLMAKSMLVTWPFVFLLLDYWPLRRLEWEPADGLGRFTKAWVPLIREKLPLFCLVAASMVVTYLAQSYGGTQALVDAPFPLRLSNALASYAKYLLLTGWPRGLGAYYPLSPGGVPAWQLAVAVVVLGAITAIALREAKKRPYLIVGWLWFLGTLIPVIGLVQVGSGFAMADRYHYIPSIGLFVAIVFGFADLAIAWRLGRATITAVSAIVLLLLAFLAGIQVRYWHDSMTLFERTLSVTSNNMLMQNQLGSVLNRQGKHAEAIRHFDEALRIKPDYFHALANMARVLRQQGQTAEAIGFYRRALKVRPDSVKAHMQLALLLVKEEKGDEALEQFHEAMELAPNDPDVRTNLGLMLARQGKFAEATAQLSEALRLEPNSADAHNNLGLVLLMAGQPEKSLPHFSAALRLKPNFTAASDNLKRAQRESDARQK
jgi:Tfp pilus assembly protein PilF